MEDIVTVTCNRDLYQQVIQSKSIQKFLNPCRHTIIINELNPNLKKWRKLLAPYYNKHELIIKSYPPIYRQGYNDGWHSQQVYKFKVYQDIKKDYLILDSKNFFIKKTHLDLWKNILGCGSWGPIKNLKLYKPMVKSYANYLGIKPSDEHIRDQTPFKICASFIDRIKNFDVFLEWFSNNPVVTSQFTFYSLLTQDVRKNYKQQMPYITFWPDTEKKELYKLYNTKGINVIGFHRRFLSKLNFQEKNFVNNFIEEILEG